jgi:hypothetical protein
VSTENIFTGHLPLPQEALTPLHKTNAYLNKTTNKFIVIHVMAYSHSFHSTLISADRKTMRGKCKNSTAKNKIYTLILPLSLVFILLISTNCFAWHWPTHREMTVQAIEAMPEYMQHIMRDPRYFPSLITGVYEPDIIRVVDHQDVHACARMISLLAKRAEHMIRAGGSWELILFTMGKATHYIQDLNQPQHCSPRETRQEHKQFEDLAQYGFLKKDYYDGFDYIQQYRQFANNTARFSVRYIEYTTAWDLLINHTFYRRLITPIWTHAVNDTADLWLTIMKNGLSEDKYWRAGLPAPLRTRGDTMLVYKEVTLLPPQTTSYVIKDK